MIKAIARAFCWQRLLENGTYGCLDEIAKAERIDPSFVSRTIRLALLAPDIVDAILEGRQPAHLTLKELLMSFPVEWESQKATLYASRQLNVLFKGHSILSGLCRFYQTWLSSVMGRKLWRCTSP